MIVRWTGTSLKNVHTLQNTWFKRIQKRHQESWRYPGMPQKPSKTYQHPQNFEVGSNSTACHASRGFKVTQVRFGACVHDGGWSFLP
jgi:hypothetical protein